MKTMISRQPSYPPGVLAWVRKLSLRPLKKATAMKRMGNNILAFFEELITSSAGTYLARLSTLGFLSPFSSAFTRKGLFFMGSGASG